MYPRLLKRIIDFILALSGIVILSPVLLLIIIILFLANNGKVFFIQKRPGKMLNIIKIIKFRTMTDNRDSIGNLLPDSLRLTAIGKFIRTTSIDELPQLFNVLKGDMSLIGPRPLLVEYIPLYSKHQARRHEVRPGITGWAQVNGRNAISWQQKFEFDIWYVDNISFWLDIRIIFLTIKKVLVREGITSKTSETMEAFKGNTN
ncbi:MAG: sugar transferase [Bacteroidales bacterium]|nr:sugar transferase [Bacteroidales bacterium]